MPIATNNNNLGTAIDNLYTGNGLTTKFFTVTVKDSSASAMDLRAHDDSSGNFHKDGLVDRVLQIAQTRGTIVYFNVKNASTGVITIGMEGEFATATNLATAFDNSDGSNNLSVKYRNTASSTTEDGTADIAGTTVAADTLV
jgi:hypothetical protein